MKLTLSINQQIAASAKEYAKKHNASVSRLVESYLVFLTKAEAAYPRISPLVQSLSGVIRDDGNNNEKMAYRDFLAKKYR